MGVFTKWFFSFIVFLTLVACDSAQKYTLTSVLPTPVTPGSTATAFGTLPKDATLFLNETSVTATVVSGGLQFRVPDDFTAGNATVSIQSGGQTLTGTLQIQPVIESMQVVEQTLEVRGKGWSAQVASGLELYLAGTKVTPSRVETGLLVAPLPAITTFGSLAVQVVVNQQTSRTSNLTREAGSVTGKVIFPAPPTGQSSVPRLLEQPRFVTEDSRSLIVVHLEGALDKYLSSHRDVKADYLAPLHTTRLQFASATQAHNALEELQSLIGVSFVQFDDIMQVQDFQATALTVKEISALDADAQWHLSLIGVQDAWTITKGNGVVVAVVDTGVSLNHPDLTANLLPGYDFVDNDTEPFDRSGHGIHVAGLIGANGQVHGTAPEAKLLPVRVLADTSGGSAFTVAQRILWAAGLLGSPANPNPAKVINLSLGSSSFSETIAAAIQKVLAEGVIVVAAAGNSGGNLAYPAAQQGVIAVTALAGPVTAYQPWYASKGMGTWVTAYGGDRTQDQNKDGKPDGILSTYLVGDEPSYAYDMGTSMAAPQVSGLAALALASGTPTSLVKNTLANTATELGTKGYDTNFGFGLAVGRTVTATSPRSYVVAVNQGGDVLGWSLIQTDATYVLSNLTPGLVAIVFAASDEDGDGVLAEAGELRSQNISLTVQSSSAIFLTELLLNPTDGAKSVTLEARP